MEDLNGIDLTNHRRFPTEFRFKTETRQGKTTKKIVGHAAVFDRTADLGPFIERIAKGAFSRTIEKSDIRALFNHNVNYPLGRTSNNTLKLREDEKGLWMEIELPETSWARDLMVSIERRDITGASIGFKAIKQDWIEGEKLTRVLKEIELFDVSPVTYPAYSQTDVSLRKEAEAIFSEYRSLKNRYNSRSDKSRLKLAKRRLQLLELAAGLPTKRSSHSWKLGLMLKRLGLLELEI